ncbi:alpha/beta-hydrolase [Tilletiopsis washingtonensis]|uniref:Alpha/beta-hydrolase n=1 Tax=Tilletiopsis washingtonensis TaxID=58919 RepID=A0A316ZBD4_9BASI|nr:alpha/beta-hydrolase [Tilletiopsis washingtonensis]PWN98861.1 alpha/beta-hydrolase [Tilletiopsis washingtonensis]
MLFSSAFAALALAASAVAAPTSPPLPTTDAPFSVSAAKLEAAITCPNGIKGAAGGVVLLVPGTGLTGEDSFPEGPFVQLLPTAGPGFDVCWVSPPNSQLGDAQVNAEYVAHAIMSLAPRSKNGKVKVVAHSQGGGLNVPWATIFWPSARRKVASFVGLAPDFGGTTLLPPVGCAAETIASLGQGCSAAILQQDSTSNYLKAQRKIFPRAIVPTTAFFTRTDEIVIPQFGPNPSSALAGSVQFPLQDICGPLAIADHLSMLATPAAYSIVLNAFTSADGRADLSKFNKADCFNFENSNININDVVPGLKFAANLLGAVSTSGGVYVKREPPLKQYVCDAGAATKCG